ncbi:MAG: bifunctional hydroxymethylpyrimidine kinase/phosphomethylpyrimidine kinase [bacterium]|nr:bifunctional hydroxymethylpyrimidine kinase/phosphomethylpyrimidine kinase [bacterium]
MTLHPIACTVAGSDPTGGAGLQLDLQVFRSLGVHGSAVPTALTTQDTCKVHRVLPTFPSVVLDQLRVLLGDLPPHALKLGMLASDDVVRSVALALESLPGGVPIVIDPILFASDGTPLLERRAWPMLQELIGRAALVTPNRPEAEALLDCEAGTRKGAEDAARGFVEELRADAALVKGGHAEGPPDDVLAVREGDRVHIEWLPGKRIETGPVHGTGCALSAAITAELAKGRDIHEAIATARGFVADAIQNSFAAGSGAQLLGLPGPA